MSKNPRFKDKKKVFKEYAQKKQSARDFYEKVSKPENIRMQKLFCEVMSVKKNFEV